jgi:hypothetical protein
MSGEQDRILKLLEEKKITAEEAARLLDSMNRADAGPAANRFIKVRVTEPDGKRPRVNITLPVGLVRWAMKLAPDSAKAKFNEHEIDMQAVADALERGITGKIVDVQDEEKGQHVEVWLE